MIPRIIHYCWFGGGVLPPSAVRCIESWKKFLPDYEIKEWNENNFDVNMIPYSSEAYAVKKYAFVSDYARFWILYKYGGLYFDTDVLILKDMSGIISNGPFMGFEQPPENVNNGTDRWYGVAPGLGIGARPGLILYKEILDYYKTLHFIGKDGKSQPVTVVQHTTSVLIKDGLVPNNELQNVCGIWIYPWSVFCPQSFYTGRLKISSDTVSIHLYTSSWSDPYHKFIIWLERIFGQTFLQILVKIKHFIKG